MKMMKMKKIKMKKIKMEMMRMRMKMRMMMMMRVMRVKMKMKMKRMMIIDDHLDIDPSYIILVCCISIKLLIIVKYFKKHIYLMF